MGRAPRKEKGDSMAESVELAVNITRISNTHFLLTGLLPL
jgi:hypothetical protein